MPHRAPLLALACLSAAAWLWPADAAAQVRRCVRPDGMTVYTDRHCMDVGGVERRPRHDESFSGSRRIYRGGCARNLQDLVFELTRAIDSGDVNQLASVYHWAGMSGRNSSAVMTRLDAVVQRPLIDIVPVMPAAADDQRWSYSQSWAEVAPQALRIEQTLANSATPSRTVFGLQRHYGCWWIRG